MATLTMFRQRRSAASERSHRRSGASDRERESVTEGTILRWLVPPGGAIGLDQPRRETP